MRERERERFRFDTPEHVSDLDWSVASSNLQKCKMKKRADEKVIKGPNISGIN